MTKIDILRNNLIDKLLNTKNEHVLKAVEAILIQSQEKERVYELSESQIQDLKDSEEQINKGQTIDNNILLKQARQWLKEKES